MIGIKASFAREIANEGVTIVKHNPIHVGDKIRSGIIPKSFVDLLRFSGLAGAAGAAGIGGTYFVDNHNPSNSPIASENDFLSGVINVFDKKKKNKAQNVNYLI